MKLIDEMSKSYIAISPDSRYILVSGWYYLIDMQEAKKYRLCKFLELENESCHLSVIKWSQDGNSILIKLTDSASEPDTLTEYWEIGLKP